MKVLLDTCTFLWILEDAPDLSKEAREIFLNEENEIHLSVVSIWEIAIKHGLGRLTFPESLAKYIPKQRSAHGIAELELNEESALHVSRLPNLHRDPFDRMLISQAIIHQMTILTPDPLVTTYPARVLW